MTLPTAHFRTAQSRDELEQCYALVYREWEKLGYLAGGELRYSLFNALPETATFVGINNSGEIFMTASIIPDSELGLPIDATFEDKLVPYRNQERKLAEVSMLAFDSSKNEASKTQRLFLLLQMFSAIFSHARSNNIDMLCAKVHTRHAASYEPLMFKDFEEVRDNPNVKDMPVSGKILDITAVTNHCTHKEQTSSFPCDIYFNDPGNTQVPYHFTKEDLSYFFIKKQPIFRAITASDALFLATKYPDIDFPELLATLYT